MLSGYRIFGHVKTSQGGHALTNTILHDPTIPASSIELNANQYSPHAQELTTMIKLRILSDLKTICILFSLNHINSINNKLIKGN